jgi:hypothetical protein
MTESFWESEVVEEAQAEPPAAEQVAEPAAESGALALSTDDFAALEERILRTVNLVKQERQARTAAEERASQAEAKLGEQAPLVDSLQAEIKTLREERDHVRQRVERILSQLDALEL